jgi:hypothetical protein
MRRCNALILLRCLGIAGVAALSSMPAAAQSVPSIALAAGEPQVVFRWQSDRCAPDDFADSPARAFRTAEGQVRLIASHMEARLMTGPDLDHLRHDCHVAFSGRHDDDPGAYDDRAWILSPYTLDGRTVFALVHDEFHGNLRPALCPSRDYQRCWFNALTFAVSRDGGASFASPPPPGHLVMALPYRYEGERGRAGYFNPSNIVAHDGYYYALVLTVRFRDQDGGVCLIRTDRLDDPSSWRGWDGSAFAVRFADPYRERIDDPRNHVCAPVGPGRLVEAVSLVRHEPGGTWVAVMAGAVARAGERERTPGIYAATSPDLLHWSPPQLLLAAPIYRPTACAPGTTISVGYPALIDPSSESRNFETFGAHGWLYFTRFNLDHCRPSLDRDLVRMRVDMAER